MRSFYFESTLTNRNDIYLFICVDRAVEFPGCSNDSLQQVSPPQSQGEEDIFASGLNSLLSFSVGHLSYTVSVARALVVKCQKLRLYLLKTRVFGRLLIDKWFLHLWSCGGSVFVAEFGRKCLTFVGKLDSVKLHMQPVERSAC